VIIYHTHITHTPDPCYTPLHIFTPLVAFLEPLRLAFAFTAHSSPCRPRGTHERFELYTPPTHSYSIMSQLNKLVVFRHAACAASASRPAWPVWSVFSPYSVKCTARLYAQLRTYANHIRLSSAMYVYACKASAAPTHARTRTHRPYS